MPFEKDSIRVQLTYPLAQVEKPLLYLLVKEHRLVPNIRRANINAGSGGFIYLELSGDRADLERGLAFLEREGIGVNAIGLDGSEEWAV